MMKNITYALLSLVFVFSAIEAEGQDPRFSQFYAAPLHLNPAMTGVFEGQMRIAVNYRDQWSSILGDNPFRTIGAGFDMRYNIVGDDYFAVGVQAVRDQAGNSYFTTTRAHLSLAYMKQLGGGRYRSNDQYLIAGLQLGGGQNSIDISGLWFSNQFDIPGERIDLTLANGETVNDRTNIYSNFNVGLLWYALFDDNMSIYAGGAFFHLNQPNISFFEGGYNRLYRRWIGNLGGEIPFTEEFSILPAVQVMGQGPSFESTFGANFRYSNNDWREIAVRIGIWSRLVNKLDDSIHQDAYIVAAILELERLSIGLSYDINSSSLTTASNYRGAFELSLIYTNKEKKRVLVNCPNF